MASHDPWKRAAIPACIALLLCSISLFAVMTATADAQANSSGFVAIAAGEGHTLGLKGDGTVWACGYDYYGECGVTPDDAGNGSYVLPWTQVPGLANVVAVSAGLSFSMALESDGTVWTWGDGNMLGNGYSNNSSYPVPVQVPGLSGVKAIAAGQDYALVLKDDGTVWGWGNNYYGILGNGTSIGAHGAAWPMYYSYVPVQINGLSDISKIFATTGNPVAIKSDGTVWTWGFINSITVNDNVLPPTEIPGISDAADVAGGYDHIAVLKGDGTVWTVSGNIEYGIPDTSEHPVQVAGLSDIVDISGIAEHTLALSKNGTVWAWGQNYYGQLGDGSEQDRESPVEVPLSGVSQIAAGMHFSMVTGNDGTVWAWGNDASGQLGDGDYKEVPVGSRYDKMTPEQMIVKASGGDMTGPAATPGSGQADTSSNVAGTSDSDQDSSVLLGVLAMGAIMLGILVMAVAFSVRGPSRKKKK